MNSGLNKNHRDLLGLGQTCYYTAISLLLSIPVSPLAPPASGSPALLDTFRGQKLS